MEILSDVFAWVCHVELVFVQLPFQTTKPFFPSEIS